MFVTVAKDVIVAEFVMVFYHFSALHELQDQSPTYTVFVNDNVVLLVLKRVFVIVFDIVEKTVVDTVEVIVLETVEVTVLDTVEVTVAVMVPAELTGACAH